MMVCTGATKLERQCRLAIAEHFGLEGSHADELIAPLTHVERWELLRAHFKKQPNAARDIASVLCHARLARIKEELRAAQVRVAAEVREAELQVLALHRDLILLAQMADLQDKDRAA